jgi:hypothetical protein
MKTTGRKNPNHGATLPRNRADGAVGQDRSRSIRRAAKQEKLRPQEKCFFLTLPFMELIRNWLTLSKMLSQPRRMLLYPSNLWYVLSLSTLRIPRLQRSAGILRNLSDLLLGGRCFAVSICSYGCRRRVSETLVLLIPSRTIYHFFWGNESTRGFLPMLPPVWRPWYYLGRLSSFSGEHYNCLYGWHNF